MHLRALGMSDRAIAEALSVSAKTVAKSARVAAWRRLGRAGRGLRAPGPPLEGVLELGGDA
jgi:transposase